MLPWVQDGPRQLRDASGRTDAHDTALFKAEKEYPQATEYDIRITRFSLLNPGLTLSIR
ncbi:hypothetical protein [Leptothoe sp. PORK10 BA2]|uniref:hypothetical protein n=1 Tax=Leptothoe sp. PORK10 BA2 TaxID=3110254 RepID=UPI002B1F7D29|nr:hypothetical protein [Leptothoe sp. PORK10 BA2]MEA5464259.1 hypothetical protein [Leptothoe sp. PORK10 BA2]